MVLLQGLGLYRGEKKICKRPAKITVKKRKEPKQSIKEYQETIYYNTILAGPMLERYIEVKNTKAN